MPQGRRKTPFSGKAKKEQLKLKKQRQGMSKPLLLECSEDQQSSKTNKLNYQPTKNPDSKANRYALVFFKENDEVIKERKKLAMQSLVPVKEEELDIEVDQYFPKELDFPRRPEWSYELSREELDARENRYFAEYLKKVEQTFESKAVGFFELNLETWRQLWRVIEMSDIVLYIVDIRFSALMFPPSLYDYVINDLKKDFILVLNKIDLAPAPLVVAWKSYFKDKYPDIHIVMFTTMPTYNLFGNSSNKAGLQVRRRKGKLRMAAEGAQMLLEVCKSIVGKEVDLTSWEKKIQEEMHEDFEEEKIEVEQIIEQKTHSTDYFQHEKYKNGILTIGCIGQPNVGKSSIMNAIKGRKIVSVSKTPGHTKHFQTIFLTQNIKLCDCPGLVFPSQVPKTVQVLMGSFPIAQLREPYSAIKYLAERLDLPKLLRIEHPTDDDTWSAMDICDGWARKRGFLTAKAARLDTYRGANSLLRMALDGKICLCLRPPKYSSRTDFWSAHPEVQKVLWIQAKSNAEGDTGTSIPYPESSDISDDDKQTDRQGCVSSGDDDSNEQDDSSDYDSEEEINVVTNKFAALQD